MIKFLNKQNLLLLFIGFISFSCNEEINNLNKEKTEPLTVENAKKWFEMSFPLDNKNTMFKVKAKDSTVFALKPLLNWDIAQLDNDSLWSVVELPWEYENGKVTMSIPEVKSYAENNNVDFKPILRLVILKNKQTGETYGFKMAVIPELNYMLSKGGDISSNDYFDRDANFSGLIMYYSVDDKFVNGWQYSKGKITGALKQTNPKANRKALKSEYRIDIMEVQVCGYYYSEYAGVTYYGVDCYSTYYYLNVISSDYFEDGGSGGNFYGSFDTDYGGGGGGTEGTQTSTTKDTALSPTNTPCANLWAMNNDPDFVSTINTLYSSTKSNYETEKFMNIDSSGKYNFQTSYGETGSGSVHGVYTGKLDAVLHNHYDGLVGIFTLDDIASMYKIYADGNMKDVSTFQSILVTSQGVYSISIQDKLLFTTFGSNLSDSGLGLSRTIMDNEYNKYITSNTPAGVIANKFSQYLKDHNVGLSLMVTNQKFDSIVNKTVDANNTVQSTSCK